LANIRKDEILRRLIKDYAVELKLLEEAYVASRYAATGFEEEEVLRVKKVVNEVIRRV
jgi:ferritin-like protein